MAEATVRRKTKRDAPSKNKHLHVLRDLGKVRRARLDELAEIDKEVAKAVRAADRSRSLTRHQIAYESGLARSQVYNIINGKS